MYSDPCPSESLLLDAVVLIAVVVLVVWVRIERAFLCRRDLLGLRAFRCRVGRLGWLGRLATGETETSSWCGVEMFG